MSSSPSFVGTPRVEIEAISLADPTPLAYTAGVNGGIVRRIWVNAVADSGNMRVNITLGDFMVGYAIIVPTGETAYSDSAWTTQAVDLLLAGVFPGLSLEADRYFELGPGEVLSVSAGQADGTALEAGELVHVRIQGADY